MKRHVALAMLASGLAGCASATDQFKSEVDPGAVNFAKVPSVSLQVSSQDAPTVPAKPAMVSGLSDHAQAELVKLAVSKDKGATPASVMLSLLNASKPPDAKRDLTKVSKQIVATLAYTNRYLPEDSRDRIACAVITIKLENGLFASWDQVKTSYATVSLGSVGTERDFTLAGEVDPKVGGALSAVKVSPSYTNKDTQSVTLSDRVVTLSGQLSPHRAVIFQEGAPTQDLVGNTVLNVAVVRSRLEDVDVFSATDLVKASQDFEPANVALKKSTLTTSAFPVTATVQFTYVLRKVVDGWRTLPENDDKVAFLQGDPAASELEIAPGQSLFEIWTAKGAISVEQLDAHGAAMAATTQVLRFETLADTQAFLNWLRRHPTKVIKNYALVTNFGSSLSSMETLTLHKVDQQAGLGTQLDDPIYVDSSTEDLELPSSCKSRSNIPNPDLHR